MTYAEIINPVLLLSDWGILTRPQLGDFKLAIGARSFLARNDHESYAWRLDFIRTFLERNIPQLGFQIPTKKLGRFWNMCAYVHGQILNSSKIGESLSVSYHTVRSYVDLLEQPFLLRVLMPYDANLKKRLIKSPKIFICDTGLLHALLAIETHNDLLGHPVYGFSWEGFAIENLISSLPQWKPFFYRTASGSEIDLILEKGRRVIAIEFKASTAPVVTGKFRTALEILEIKKAWIVAPVMQAYPVDKHISVAPIETVIQQFQ